MFCQRKPKKSNGTVGKITVGAPTCVASKVARFRRSNSGRFQSTAEIADQNCYWLVVSTPLKDMKVNWDDDIPNTWKKCSKPPTTYCVWKWEVNLVNLNLLWPCQWKKTLVIYNQLMERDSLIFFGKSDFSVKWKAIEVLTVLTWCSICHDQWFERCWR